MGTFTEHNQLDIEDLGLSKDAQEQARSLKNSEDDKVSVTTIIKKEKKISVKQPFVLAFTENLCALASLNISQNELKIITYILKCMEFGNLINLNQSAIARDLGLQRSNVSSNFKKLKDKGILIENDGHLYMNSNLFTKGLSHSLTTEKREGMKNARGDLINDKQKVRLEPTF